MSFEVLPSIYTLFAVYNFLNFPITTNISFSVIFTTYTGKQYNREQPPISLSMFSISDLTARIKSDSSFFTLYPNNVSLLKKNLLIRFTANTNCELLMVGGGSGGSGKSGAGAGGGVLYRSNILFLSGYGYKLVIGNGGNGLQPGFDTYINNTVTGLLTASGGGVATTEYISEISMTFYTAGSTTSDIDGVITTYTGGTGYHRYDISNIQIPPGAGAAGNGGGDGQYNGGVGYFYFLGPGYNLNDYFFGSGAPGREEFIINNKLYTANIGNDRGGYYGHGGLYTINSAFNGNPGCIIIKIL